MKGGKTTELIRHILLTEGEVFIPSAIEAIRDRIREDREDDYNTVIWRSALGKARKDAPGHRFPLGDSLPVDLAIGTYKGHTAEEWCAMCKAAQEENQKLREELRALRTPKDVELSEF